MWEAFSHGKVPQTHTSNICSLFYNKKSLFRECNLKQISWEDRVITHL